MQPSSARCISFAVLATTSMASPLTPAFANHGIPASVAVPSREPSVRLQNRGAEGFASLPQCANPCLSQYCSPQNATCLCGMRKTDLNKCILAACPIPEAIFSRNITETTCRTPVRNKSVQYNILVLTLLGFTAPTIAARLVFKQFFSAQQRLDREDWTILSAAPVGIVSVVLSVYGLTRNGLGIDLWGLEPKQLMDFGLYFYIIQMLYIVLMTLIKLTLVFFYLNIFTGHGIRILLWMTAGVHALAGFGFTVGIVFQCMPISYQWQKYDLSKDNSQLISGHCININAAGWGHGALSVSSDLWLLAIPLSQIRKLQLPWKKRLCATLMFMTGAIITLVSCLRLASIRKYYSTSNPTWDQWDITWWSCIELQVGLICVCLPAIRLILIQLARRLFHSEPKKTRPSMSTNTNSTPWHARLCRNQDPAVFLQGKALLESSISELRSQCDANEPKVLEPVHLSVHSSSQGDQDQQQE